MTRKIRQPSRGKASQPYRFGAWRPRVGEKIGKGNGRKRFSMVQGTDPREVDCRLRQQHAPVCLAAAQQQQQQQQDSDAGGV